MTNTALKMTMTLLQLLALCCALPRDLTMGEVADSIRSYVGSEPPAQASSRSKSSWTWTEGARSVTVTVAGRVEFADDYSDVKSIRDDGVFVIEERRGDAERKLEIVSSSSGTLERIYSINGQAKEFDAEAAGWLKRTLSVVLPKSGLDAGAKAERLLKEGGARALIDESARTENDRARREYLAAALRKGNLDPASLQKALLVISSRITSDFERGNLIIEFSDIFLSHPDLTAAYFGAIGKLSSSYEQRRVLTSVLNKTKANKEALLQALGVAGKISYDHDKASFLLEHAALYQADADLRSAFGKAVSSIKSDYQRQQLQTVLDKLNRPN